MSLLDIFNSVIKLDDKAPPITAPLVSAPLVLKPVPAPLVLKPVPASVPTMAPAVKPKPVQNKVVQSGNIMDIFNSIINPEPVKPKVPTYADILNSGTTKTDKVIISNIVASPTSPNNLLNELRNYVDKIKSEPSIKSWAEQSENDEEACD